MATKRKYLPDAISMSSSNPNFLIAPWASATRLGYTQTAAVLIGFSIPNFFSNSADTGEAAYKKFTV